MKYIKGIIIVNILLMIFTTTQAQDYPKKTNLFKIIDCEISGKKLMIKTMRIVKTEDFAIDYSDADLLMFTTELFYAKFFGQYNVALDITIIDNTIEVRGFTNYSDIKNDRNRVYKHGMKGSPARDSFKKMAKTAKILSQKCKGTLNYMQE